MYHGTHERSTKKLPKGWKKMLIFLYALKIMAYCLIGHSIVKLIVISSKLILSAWVNRR